jgi:hypothetical protein
MNRFLLRLALVVVLVLVLGPSMLPSAHADGASPFCYNLDFANNTAEDATGLLAHFGGIQRVDDVYIGVWNPFGSPTPASGYDAQTDTYALEFAGGPAYAGDTVHAGLCTNSPVLQRPTTGNVPPLSWQTAGGRVTPDPLFVGVRWTWSGPNTAGIEFFNQGPVGVTLMAVNLLDPSEPLALEDLIPSVVAGLPIIDELITEPMPLAAGGMVSSRPAFVQGAAAAAAGSFGVTASALNRPVVLEVDYQADDDPGNVGHLYVQALTPAWVYLPLVLR